MVMEIFRMRRDRAFERSRKPVPPPAATVERMSQHSTPFARRRHDVAQAMGAAGGGIAIVPTAPERQRNGDNDHPYRHGSDFHYLTGFAEPGAWLVIDASGRTTLVCRPKDVEREIWDGVRLGPDAAPAALGVDAAVPLDRLDETMIAVLADQPAVWWLSLIHI